MTIKWYQSDLQKYIDDEIEERITLDYKRADALGRSEKDKKEITKDVSALANADGGILIYGISEYDAPDKKHLPERLDAVDRTSYSKEWLEHIISNIRPKIKGLIVHPVDLNTGPNDVAYVVEVPKSDTAHQANDRRYYLRYNFESVAMEDYQIRDVMHRRTVPNVSIEFSHKLLSNKSDGKKHLYSLEIFIENHGPQLVNHYQIVFSVPKEISMEYSATRVSASHHNLNVETRQDRTVFRIYRRSSGVLFPEEKRDIGSELGITYKIDNQIYHQIKMHNLTLNWQLFADNMPRKDDQYPFMDLQDF